MESSSRYQKGSVVNNISRRGNLLRDTIGFLWNRLMATKVHRIDNCISTKQELTNCTVPPTNNLIKWTLARSIAGIEFDSILFEKLDNLSAPGNSSD
jgi:hypothetical protein